MGKLSTESFLGELNKGDRVEEDNVSDFLAKAATIKKEMETLPDQFNSAMVTALNTAGRIKRNLEALERSNIANRSLLAVCREGSYVDSTKMEVTKGVWIKLNELIYQYTGVRNRPLEHKEFLRRGYFNATGKVATDEEIDKLVSVNGEVSVAATSSELDLGCKERQEAVKGKDFLGFRYPIVLEDKEDLNERDIVENVSVHGNSEIFAGKAGTGLENKERQKAAREVHNTLTELHQVFLVMSAFFHASGNEHCLFGDKRDVDMVLVLHTARSLKAKLEDFSQSTMTLSVHKEGCPVVPKGATISNSLRIKVKELVNELHAVRKHIFLVFKEDLKRSVDSGDEKVTSVSRNTELDAGNQEWQEVTREIHRFSTELLQTLLDMVDGQAEEIDEVEDSCRPQTTIDDLTVDVIHEIMSRMDIQDVGRLSICSKKWHRIVLTSPCYNINVDAFESLKAQRTLMLLKTSSFMNYIDWLFASRSPDHHLLKLSITCNIPMETQKKVQDWVRKSLEFNVKEVELNTGCLSAFTSKEFPSLEIFRLNANMQKFDVSILVGFRSLRVLELVMVKIPIEALSLPSEFEALKCLTLENCYGFITLTVCHPTLESFHVNDPLYSNLLSITFECPCLRNLILKFYSPNDARVIRVMSSSKEHLTQVAKKIEKEVQALPKMAAAARKFFIEAAPQGEICTYCYNSY